jgi:hypothetical protein
MVGQYFQARSAGSSNLRIDAGTAYPIIYCAPPTMHGPAETPSCCKETRMRVLLFALLCLQLLGLHAAVAADGKFAVELNTIEPAENRCRLNFVIENKSNAAVDSMNLDLVVFGTDGGILRRLLTQMGPVRPQKTIVRAFVIDVECGQIGSVLVNEVNACAPGNPNACLDGLSLSSRLKEVRFYK